MYLSKAFYVWCVLDGTAWKKIDQKVWFISCPTCEWEVKEDLHTQFCVGKIQANGVDFFLTTVLELCFLTLKKISPNRNARLSYVSGITWIRIIGSPHTLWYTWFPWSRISKYKYSTNTCTKERYCPYYLYEVNFFFWSWGFPGHHGNGFIWR